MTSPLCRAASANAMPSQDQASTPSSKAKSSKAQAKKGYRRAKGSHSGAWTPPYSKTALGPHSPQKLAKHKEVVELQRKIQLLGKRAPGSGVNGDHPGLLDRAWGTKAAHLRESWGAVSEVQNFCGFFHLSSNF